MNPVEQYLSEKLNKRTQAGNLRSLSLPVPGIDFFSNDYLGLVTTGILQDLMQDSHKNFATGSKGARLIAGNSKEIEELESFIASFHSGKAALLFNSGYNANTGLISAITSRHTVILYDELCHASIIDGMRLSQTEQVYKFRHNDLNDFREKIQKYKDGNPLLIITESVFSMDGDLAPLAEMAELANENDAQLIVDEAHATGVVGEHGEGLVCALGLQQQVFATVYTFGKALGCHGAAVVGSDLLKQYLLNFSRSFIFTTALPPHAIAAATFAYQYLASPQFSNRSLHELVTYFRQRIKEHGHTGWKDSTSPIQVFITGSNEKSKNLSAILQEKGLQVKAILNPTVPLGSERLRVCLHSFNTKEQVDLLVDAVNEKMH